MFLLFRQPPGFMVPCCHSTNMNSLQCFYPSQPLVELSPYVGIVPISRSNWARSGHVHEWYSMSGAKLVFLLRESPKYGTDGTES